MPTDPSPAAPEALTAVEQARVPSAPRLLLTAREAAALCGVSLASWRRHAGAGKVPAPGQLGGHVLWRYAELVEFIAAGCPDRRAWEALRDHAAQTNGRR
ncbi:MAG TPA: helix-turn-helix domain-containing protein [Gemmataceae bacterium]|jgi:predicted DNA-binding transcriptional regulator AlpA|nr:helix-turn-helix domain-containing protein [Gemmataceae bacterium]